MTEVRWGLMGVNGDFPPLTISSSIDRIFHKVENPHPPPPTPIPTVRRGERGRPVRGAVTKPTDGSETMVRETFREEQCKAELWREQLLHDQREARSRCSSNDSSPAASWHVRCSHLRRNLLAMRSTIFVT
jgi:hypothetical protein